MAKILLTIPDDMLKDLDERCKKLHYERSEFVREIIRDKIYFVPSVGEQTGDHLEKISEKKIPQNHFPTIEEAVDAFVALPTVGMCVFCRVKKEVNTVDYDDANGEPMTFQVCESDMKKAYKQQENQGGRILKINGVEV